MTDELASDIETDAKTEPSVSSNNPVNLNVFRTKCDKFHKLEDDVLRPKDQYEQRLSVDKLIDVVIVFARSDYDIALNYKDYLETIARHADIEDVIVTLYDRGDLPANDVKLVEEVVNRSMRVVMLLSEHFLEEVNLTFIKEEAIGLTRLQEYPPEEQMSLFATEIVNRKKDAIRPVHTVPKHKRYYRTPVGLSVLRCFEYFENNKNQKYEDDLAASFLKQARLDRRKHTNDLTKHQSFNMGNIELGKEYSDLKTPKSSFESQANNVFKNGDRISGVIPDLYTESSVVCKSRQAILNASRSNQVLTNTDSLGLLSKSYEHESVKTRVENHEDQTSKISVYQGPPLRSWAPAAAGHNGNVFEGETQSHQAVRSVHYHYHYRDGPPREDIETDQGPSSWQEPISQGPNDLSRPLHQAIRSRPIINIQSCGTVQIGDYNTTSRNQVLTHTLTDTNNISQQNERKQESIGNMPGDTESDVEEKYLDINGSSQKSLNDLGFNNRMEIEKVYSLENINDEGNDDCHINGESNESDESGNSCDENDVLSIIKSASCSDENEATITVEEKEKELPEEKGTSLMDSSQMHHRNANDNHVMRTCCCQYTRHCDKNDFMQLLSHLKTNTRKTEKCTQFHFNRYVNSVHKLGSQDLLDDVD